MRCQTSPSEPGGEQRPQRLLKLRLQEDDDVLVTGVEMIHRPDRIPVKIRISAERFLLTPLHSPTRTLHIQGGENPSEVWSKAARREKKGQGQGSLNVTIWMRMIQGMNHSPHGRLERLETDPGSAGSCSSDSDEWLRTLHINVPFPVTRQIHTRPVQMDPARPTVQNN